VLLLQILINWLQLKKI